MTIYSRLLQTVIAGMTCAGVCSAGVQAQDLPPITKVAIGPTSTALSGSYVIPRFWNASGIVTVVSTGGEPVYRSAGRPILAVVSQGLTLSDGRGGSFQVPAGAQVSARYVRRNDWKTIDSCVVYDSVQVGGTSFPVNGYGGCLPLGSWNLSVGSSLAWVVPEAGPEAFPQVAPGPTTEDPTKAATS